MARRVTGKLLLAVILLAAAASAAAYIALSRESPAQAPQGAPLQAGQVRARLELDQGLLGNLSVVALGPDNASVYIYIFYDAYCPYCGLEITESADYLASLAQRCRVVLVDFLVHSNALEPQAIIRCAAKQGAPILAVLDWWYSSLLKGSDPGVQGLMRQLSSVWGVQVSQDCIRAEEGQVYDVTYTARRLGVWGTPAIVIYDAKHGRVVNASVGYMSRAQLESFIEASLASVKP